VVGVCRRTAFAGARKAAGYTQESLAAALHVDRSTVIRWEAGGHAPLPYLRPRLARLLGQSPEHLRELIDGDSGARPVAEGVSVDVEVAFDWLDRRASWLPGTSRRKVMSGLGALDDRALHDRNGRRAKAGRSDVAHALSDYYGDRCIQGLGAYRARCDGRGIVTSIVTQSEWLDLACSLAPGHDRLMLASSALGDPMEIDDLAARHAVRRLIEVVDLDVRLANAPIYRLLGVDIRQGSISGTVGLVSFVEYALTMDLLEGELLDAIVCKYSVRGLTWADPLLVAC
jgi:transcriptional regulator with XRE-family HTH domain